MEEEFKNLHLQLSAEDIRRVDEWKISHGMKSRTEAIRAMIRIVTTNSPEDGSSNFGENEKSPYMKPEVVNKIKNNDSVEEIIRKVVKEELQKLK